MANFNLVLKILFALLMIKPVFAKLDRVLSEVYIGEKRLDSYHERYQPLIIHNIYNGEMSFKDDAFYKDYFKPFLFNPDTDFSHFFKNELNSGMQCSNQFLTEHFDDIRFSYRLITLSYLLEADWHLDLVSRHFSLKKGCQFDLKSWLQSCKPKSTQMKKFIDRLSQHLPKYDESLSSKYKKEDWLKDFKNRTFKFYSHYRLGEECDNCSFDQIPSKLEQMCENDKKIMTLICSEEDELFGLSKQLDAYSLIAQSNIINTFNAKGEALGCLRRFSEVMSHKEVRFSALKNLFPVIKNFLKETHKERFLQGRVFFYGSSKEFEDKGLSEVHVKAQPLIISKKAVINADQIVVSKNNEVKKEDTKIEVKIPTTIIKREEVKEIQTPVKSAFLIASEIRRTQNLDQVEVDMLKLKYDYVFSLNMMNTLSERLKTYMSREALNEMMTYDKLGLKDGPVPLLFIKFMIDMQEHQGLWNLISILGDKFYVSNEIDSSFSPEPELIQLINNQSSGNQWAILVIKP